MMSDSEIAEIANRVLRERFAQVGFSRADVATEIDFDGAPIVRVTARYAGGPLAEIKAVWDAEADIQNELWNRGDERFLFIRNQYPDLEKEIDEEQDDEDLSNGSH